MFMRDVMITTIDNPYNPFTDFEKWNRFDRQKGYNTLQYLGRVAKTSIHLSDADNLVAAENAIDDICRLNVLGLYKKVIKE